MNMVNLPNVTHSAPPTPWQRYDLRVPRYTSYPTAPHFHAGVTAASYGQWLRQLDPNLPLSLYFHIPFCAEMCWYCGCHNKIVKRYDPVRRYMDTLLTEIDLVSSRMPAPMTVHHLHWGGGSPSMLRGDDWQRAMDRLHQRFDVAGDAEIALELDPRTTTESYVATLASAGVNRVSIGVQDFDDTVQRAINRPQPFDVTQRVVDWLRGHGIDAVNLDLMYGLPHQTEALVRDMVDQAMLLNPSRIALFGYAHVPWMKSHQRLIDEAALPDALARWRQAEVAAERLTEYGFIRVGLDHFAHADDAMARAAGDGKLGRNFQGYTTDRAETLIGFGASAISGMPQGYAQNSPALRDYARAVSDGRLPIARGIAMDGDDRLRRDIIQSIMCDLEADIPDICARYGKAADFTKTWEKLAPLRADGYITIENSRLRVTEAGRPLVRVVAAAFDAYLENGAARHSQAV